MSGFRWKSAIYGHLKKVKAQSLKVMELPFFSSKYLLKGLEGVKWLIVVVFIIFYQYKFLISGWIWNALDGSPLPIHKMVQKTTYNCGEIANP